VNARLETEHKAALQQLRQAVADKEIHTTEKETLEAQLDEAKAMSVQNETAASSRLQVRGTLPLDPWTINYYHIWTHGGVAHSLCSRSVVSMFT